MKTKTKHDSMIKYQTIGEKSCITSTVTVIKYSMHSFNRKCFQILIVLCLFVARTLKMKIETNIK